MILVKTVLWLELKYPKFRDILNTTLPKNCVVRVYEKGYKNGFVVYIEIEYKRKSVKYAFLPMEDKELFYKTLESDLQKIVEREFKS